ncbi:MAG: hypothetical protein ACI8SR_000868 [Oceanicoccus sp.]|jgi:hypothetical protein
MNHFLKVSLYLLVTLLISACEYEADPEPEVSDGDGKAIADFIVQNNRLITIESSFIKIYTLADSTKPILETIYSSSDDVEFESIYAYKTNMLMIGTSEGTFFKDHTTPGTLTDLTFSEIVTSCDTAITQGNYLYITQRSDEKCSDTNNANNKSQLLIYNILQVASPSLEKAIDIDTPYGLGINGTNLFVCYEQGVIEFDISDPTDPDQTGDYSQPCNNIIASQDPMILSDNSGVRLVEYANPGLTELAIIRKSE